MGRLSQMGAGSRDSEIEALSILANGINTSLVGMTTYFPPTSKDGSVDPSWIECGGQTIARAAAPALWERVKQLDVVVSDTAWLAIQASSPNGAVSVYSSGDGSTSMRMPTTGEDGGFIRAVGTDPVLNALHDYKKGFQDQIQNIKGEFSSLAYSQNTSGIVDDDEVESGLRWLGSSPNLQRFKMTIDASRVARTGDETHPKGMYGKLYVYAGNVTTKLPIPSPDWLAQQTANTQKITEFEKRDYVIEEVTNTDAGWWYRKWNSGFVEQGGLSTPYTAGWTVDSHGASIYAFPVKMLSIKPYSIGSNGSNCTSTYFWDGGFMVENDKPALRGKFYNRHSPGTPAPSNHMEGIIWQANGYWK